MTATLAGVVPAIVDGHLHQWDPLTTPREASRFAPVYARLPGLFERLMPLLVSRDKRDLVRTAAHVARPYLPSGYAGDVAGVAEVAGVPVESAVHVQASWLGDPVDETRWVQTLPFGQDGAPSLAALVAEADPREPQVGQVLDRHAHASERFRGVRFMGAWHPDPQVMRFADEDGMLRSPAFLRGFAAVAERGLTFDAFVYSHQLGDVETLAEEYPETTIVLDHYAPPVGWLGPMGRSTGRTQQDRDRILATWRDGIERVAAYPNVVAKHSGLAFPMLGMPTVRWSRQQIVDTLAPLVVPTTELFGAQRLVFGSNFPMDKSIADLPELVAGLLELLAPYGEDVLRGTFRDNARRVYRL
jgi:predicted TIM-barrel fold metal-dependent hydrolase